MLQAVPERAPEPLITSEWDALVERNPWIVDDELYRQRCEEREAANRAYRQRLSKLAMLESPLENTQIENAGIFPQSTLSVGAQPGRTIEDILRAPREEDAAADTVMRLREHLTSVARRRELHQDFATWIAQAHEVHDAPATFCFVVPCVVEHLPDDIAEHYLKRFLQIDNVLERWSPVSCEEKALVRHWAERFDDPSLLSLLAVDDDLAELRV